MKRIALVLASLNIGGVEKNTLRLAKGFISKGYEVDLLLIRTEGPYLTQLDSKINVINLKTNSAFKSIWAIAKYLSKSKPDVLISAKDYINIVVLMAKLLANVPTKIIVTSRTQLSVELKNMKLTRKIKMIAFVKLLYPFADSIVAVSKGVSKDLRDIIGFNKINIHVIYNPIVDSEIEEKLKDSFDRSIFSTSKNIILSVGRLTAQKDFPTLLKALRIVKEEKEVLLIILGEGQEREKIENMISELGLDKDVKLLGNIYNPYPYMEMADLFVLSSKWEGFGNVIVESMAVGTPVVSTNCPSGPSEILEDGKYGILVPVEKHKDLAIAIIKGLNCEWNKCILVKRANEFTVEKAVEGYVKLFDVTK